MSLRLPPSWPRMSPHCRACYLVDSHQARDYADGRRKVGRMEREGRGKVPVQTVIASLERRNLW